MTERTKRIKGLINGQVDMGTYGLVEMELLAGEKDSQSWKINIQDEINRCKEKALEYDRDSDANSDNKTFCAYAKGKADTHRYMAIRLKRVLEWHNDSTAEK